MKLSAGTLGALAPDVARFGYDRAAQAAGLVHLGIGAFHRAHQAWYTDAALAADAEFIVSPGLTPAPGKAPIAVQVPFLPGGKMPSSTTKRPGFPDCPPRQ